MAWGILSLVVSAPLFMLLGARLITAKSRDKSGEIIVCIAFCALFGIFGGVLLHEAVGHGLEGDFKLVHGPNMNEGYVATNDFPFSSTKEMETRRISHERACQIQKSLLSGQADVSRRRSG